MSEAQLTWSAVLAWRMARHHLVERAPAERALEVASEIAGLHAQVMSSAELTLHARVEGLDRDAVQRALWEDRTLVKTWAMRGTLHLLPARELPLWTGALTTLRARYQRPAWLNWLGLTPEQGERLPEAVADALDGEPLTREELRAAVAACDGEVYAHALAESWGGALKPAAFEGRLCFAPSNGQNVRFTRPDRWLGAPVVPDAERGPAEVTRRYLGVYGPAPREQFARWFGCTAGHALRLIRGLGDEVVEVDVEGTPAWMLAADVAEAQAAEPAGVVRLLPGFDQYVVGAPRGEPASAERHLPLVYRPQGWLSPVLVIDGRIEGVWRSERRAGCVRFEMEPFARTSAVTRRVAEREAERLAAFIGGSATVAWAR